VQFYRLPPLPSVISLVPAEEQGDAHQLVSAATGLSLIVENFGLAVELFELSGQQAQLMTNALRERSATASQVFEDSESLRQKRRRYSGWQRIAARDGALQIDHMGKAIQSIRKHQHIIPTLRPLLDAKQFKISWKMFDNSFPNARLIRDAVAHSIYELAPTEKDSQSHAPQHVDIPGLATGSGIFITDSLFGNKYIITKDKKTASYEISRDSYVKLEAVRESFLHGFDNALAEVTKSWPKPSVSR
jgi:hypothetical protein